MCYCPTPTLHLNLALTGDGAFLFSLKKTHSVWFISVLNYGDTENVLINHLLLVIPVLYPCHYTNLCPHKPDKHAHTHTHTHTKDANTIRKYKIIIKKKSHLWSECGKSIVHYQVAMLKQSLIMPKYFQMQNFDQFWPPRITSVTLKWGHEHMDMNFLELWVFTMGSIWRPRHSL